MIYKGADLQVFVLRDKSEIKKIKQVCWWKISSSLLHETSRLISMQIAAQVLIWYRDKTKSISTLDHVRQNLSLNNENWRAIQT